MSRRRSRSRQLLSESVGRGVSRLQDASDAFDERAAEILALSHGDLPCMTRLLFGGPASASELATALRTPRGSIVATLDRLQLAGYARYVSGGGARVELTEHAREWIERIWSPVRDKGYRVLDEYASRDLELLDRFLRQAAEMQEDVTTRLGTWLDRAASHAHRTHLRGGLSPAALRRVQLFVEGNLHRPIHVSDMATRAALSPYHFARAFRQSSGTSPRAFVEARRVERAKRLLLESTSALADVAQEVGLGTQSRLTTVFRRRTGFTPAAFRRAHR